MAWNSILTDLSRAMVQWLPFFWAPDPAGEPGKSGHLGTAGVAKRKLCSAQIHAIPVWTNMEFPAVLKVVFNPQVVFSRQP